MGTEKVNMKKLCSLFAVSAFSMILPMNIALTSCSSDDPTDTEPVPERPGGQDKPEEEGGNEEDTLRIVDLGLNVCWADRNVGANSPYVAGEYVGSDGPVGIAVETSLYNLINFVFRNTGRNYWEIPSWEHVQELYDHCTFEEVYVDNGIKAMRVTGPNGNHIYLPLAGKTLGDDFSNVNSVGYYIYQDGPGNLTGKWRIFSGNRDSWQHICSSPIRPIAYKSEKVAWEDYFGKVPTAEEAIDLGLSVKWAPWNIGSDKAEIYGGFYGWGDPTGKVHSTNPNDYTEDKPGTIRIKDLAVAKWGANWQTPTREQMEELVNKCSWEWTQLTGTCGYRVTGPNGNSIFLPAGGFREGESRKMLETAGWYWTKTREQTVIGMRYYSLSFSENSFMMYDMRDPELGKCIRAVYVE